MTIGLTQNLGIELGLVAGLIAILYGAYLANWVIKQPAGNAAMQAIAAAIQEGAMAFLRRQYRTVAVVAVILFVIISVLPAPLGWEAGVGFLIGAVLSGAAGLHRHDRLGARERSHRGSGARRRRAGARPRVQGRFGDGLARRRPRLVRGERLLLDRQHDQRRARVARIRQPRGADRARVRLLADLGVRAPRRRHLHQSGRRRRRPRRQGRSRHPRGRSAQPGRHRRQRRRQRRRLRRHGGRLVRDVRGHDDRGDAARTPAVRHEARRAR